LAIYDKDDNLIQRFEYANNRMPISMRSNGQKYYLHYDQVGTLKAVSNTHQKIIKKITYDTYGNIRNETNKAFKVPFGFAGGLYDHDTKLTCFGYRDYDAYTGKWTAKDPIGFGGGDSNLYGYVLGDPVSFFDPDGLINRSGGHGHNRHGGGYSSGTGGVGYGGNVHLGIVGMSYYEYYTNNGKVTVQCFRGGLGVFFGGGGQLMGSLDFPTTTNNNCSNGCTKSWAIGISGALAAVEGSGAGVTIGPTGIGATYDASLGSPGAGVYGGVDICVIESCPY